MVPSQTLMCHHCVGSQRLLSLQMTRLRAYVSDDDEDSDPDEHADPSLVQCSACLATVHRMRDRHPRR